MSMTINANNHLSSSGSYKSQANEKSREEISRDRVNESARNADAEKVKEPPMDHSSGSGKESNIKDNEDAVVIDITQSPREDDVQMTSSEEIPVEETVAEDVQVKEREPVKEDIKPTDVEA